MSDNIGDFYYTGDNHIQAVIFVDKQDEPIGQIIWGSEFPLPNVGETVKLDEFWAGLEEEEDEVNQILGEHEVIDKSSIYQITRVKQDNNDKDHEEMKPSLVTINKLSVEPI